MLQLDWFTQSPIDFEHKNYLLLDYLSKVDASYSVHQLSPFLIWNEKLLKELREFENSYKTFKSSLKRELVGFSWTSGLIYSEIENPDCFKTIVEVVEYSEPLIESRIQLGYKLHKKFPQLLY